MISWSIKSVDSSLKPPMKRLLYTSTFKPCVLKYSRSLIFKFCPRALENAASKRNTTDKNDSLFMLLNYQVFGLNV